jgi:hypothetical protein
MNRKGHNTVVLIFISDSSGEERSALDWALSLLWAEDPAADIDMEVRIWWNIPV